MKVNICHSCKKEFTKTHNPNRVYKYCSPKCMGSDKEKGENHSNFMKGSVAWNKGIKGIQDWMNISGLKPGHNRGKKGCQKAWNKGLKNFSLLGDKNHNWKGGVTKINEQIRKSVEYKQWRASVYERDNYTCQICGDNKGGNLQADHIKPFAYFPEIRFNLDNGRTLCKNCHSKTDTYLNNGRWLSKMGMRQFLLIILSILSILSFGQTPMHMLIAKKASGGSVGNSRSITTVHAKVPNTDQTNFPMLFRSPVGTVNTVGTAVTLASGDNFPTWMTDFILINGVQYAVSSVTTGTALVLTTSAGTQTGVAYCGTPYLRTVANGGKVTNSSGFDIIFGTTSAATSLLSWEVESYSATTGNLIAWILFPTLHTGSDDVIYMRYGGSQSTFQGGVTGAAWNTNYKAVYHLAEATSSNNLDATANAFTLGPVNSPVQGAGEIDGSLSFNGTNQYTAQSAAATIVNPGSSSFTLECWVFYTTGATGNARIINQAIDANNKFQLIGLPDGSGHVEFLLAVLKASTDIQYESITMINVNGWHHVVASFNGTTSSFYLDGVTAATSVTFGAGYTATNNNKLYLAVRSDVATFLNGKMDEVRISNVVRSADWATTSFNNQSSPGTFYVVGAEAP